MNGKIKVFLGRFLLVCFLVIVFDQAVGRLLNHFYFKHEPVNHNSTTYVANYCDQQVLIFGSSRACYQYISNEIADKTKLTCFNAGVPGNYILYSYAMLKCVLKRYTPKVVVLDIMPDEFKFSQDNYDRLSILLPYYESHPEIREIIGLKSKYENLKLLSMIYPFNSFAIDIISRNLHTNKNEFRPDGQNGFIPLLDTINQPGDKFVNKDYENYKPDAELLMAYNSFIKECISHHIKLFVFISPILDTHLFKNNSIKIASNIALKNKIPFLDCTDQQEFKKKIFFKDFGHLNINGARLYTTEVIRQIKAQSYR